MNAGRVWDELVRHKRFLPILLLNAALVLYGIWNVRPHLMPVDAHFAVLWALKRGVERSIFIKTFFKGGNLHIQVLSAAFVPVFLWLKLTGRLDGDVLSSARSLSKQEPSIFSFWELPDAFLDIYYTFFVTARLVSAAFGIATVVLVYRMAAREYGERVGRYASVVPAVSMGFVHVAHFATEDIMMTFFITLTVFFLAVYHDTDETRYLRYGAVAFGLAASSKAIAGMLIFAVVYAHLARGQLRERAFSETFVDLTKSGALSLGAYLATTPSILVYPTYFVQDMVGTEIAYIYGQHTTEAAPLASPGWLVQTLNLAWAYGLPLFVFVVAATVYVVRRYVDGERDAVTPYVLWFVGPYFLVIASWNVDAIYYVIPIVPLLGVFAGRFAVRLVDHDRYRSLAKPVLAGVLVFSVAFSGLTVAQIADDSRVDAANWMETELEQGSDVDVYTHVMNRPVLPDDVDVHNLDGAPWEKRISRLERGDPEYVVIVSNQYTNCFQYARDDCQSFYKSLVGGEYGYEVVKVFNGPVRLEYPPERRLSDSVFPNAVHPINPTVVILKRT